MEKENSPYMKPHHTLVAGGFALPIEVNLALATCLFDSATTAMSSFPSPMHCLVLCKFTRNFLPRSTGQFSQDPPQFGQQYFFDAMD